MPCRGAEGGCDASSVSALGTVSIYACMPPPSFSTTIGFWRLFYSSEAACGAWEPIVPFPGQTWHNLVLHNLSLSPSFKFGGSAKTALLSVCTWTPVPPAQSPHASNKSIKWTKNGIYSGIFVIKQCGFRNTSCYPRIRADWHCCLNKGLTLWFKSKWASPFRAEFKRT